MLKKSASGVLASLTGSTYRNVRLASSLAAALLDGLFEHPVLLERQYESWRGDTEKLREINLARSWIAVMRPGCRTPDYVSP
jgi:hypothetical protein